MKYSSLIVTTDAGKEPVSLEEATQHLRVTEADDDSYILALINGATAYVETFTNRALINRTYQITFDGGFPNWFELPKPLLVSASSINYIDTDGISQLLAPSVYTVDTNSMPGRIVLAFSQSWPSTRDIINNITIVFVAGYGEDTDDIPMPIKQAMLLLIGHWFENRSAVVIGITSKNLEITVQSLLLPYRVRIS